jgi:flagellar basal body-associated protein FliL
MKEDPIMSSATKWRIPIGIAVVVLLIVVALILALLLSGAENGEGMQASTSATRPRQFEHAVTPPPPTDWTQQGEARTAPACSNRGRTDAHRTYIRGRASFGAGLG